MALPVYAPPLNTRPPYSNRLTSTPQSFASPAPPTQATWSVPSPVAPAVNTAAPIPNFFGRTPEAAAVINPINLAKVPGADQLIQGQFADAEQLRKILEGDSTAYRGAIAGTAGQVGQQTEQQLAILAQLFGGQFAQQLADIRARRKAAMGGLNNQLFADLRRSLNLGATGGQGVSGSGLGGYLAQLAAREAGRLRTAETYDAAEQERGDVGANLAAQMQALGRPQQLTDAMASRMMLPAQFDVTANAAYQQAVQQALNQALQNQILAYGMQT